VLRWWGLAVFLLAASGAGPAWCETIDVDGTARAYGILPADNRPAPLVIVLHGNTQTGADIASRTKWPEIARRERFSVVFPDGLNRAWADFRPNANRAGRAPPEGTDDIAFLARLIETLITEGTADPKRIYVTGVSNGGAMTMTMICARAELFAAAASIIINLTDESANACHPSRPVPLLMMNGTADPLIPYQGGRGTSRFAVPGFWSTQKTLDFWRRANGCESGDAGMENLGDRDPTDQSTVTRITSRCPQGGDVVLYRVNGGGHRMPGASSDARFPRIVDMMFGPQNHDIDGAEAIWAFFRRFP